MIYIPLSSDKTARVYEEWARMGEFISHLVQIKRTPSTAGVASKFIYIPLSSDKTRDE